ncbi:MAG: hypothetical protein MUE44_36245 [Oscillatoriaceae cyanobacterium Prado104]|nr:hypothetical protein [Oscillatoriaceae cyanobacterium Prado104]
MLPASNSRTRSLNNAAVSNSQRFWELLTARFESKVKSGQLMGRKQTNGDSLKSVGAGSLETVSS